MSPEFSGKEKRGVLLAMAFSIMLEQLSRGSYIQREKGGLSNRYSKHLN